MPDEPAQAVSAAPEAVHADHELRAFSLLRDVPDFPQPGIMFKDITPLLSDPDGLREVIDALGESIKPLNPDLIVGIESRGFIFGVPIAYNMRLGFSPVRKVGKLPHKTIKQEYALEYGTNTVEMHTDAVSPGQRVVIVDDLLATGGTAQAAAALVEQLGGIIVGYCFVIELAFLKGREKLAGRTVISLATF